MDVATAGLHTVKRSKYSGMALQGSELSQTLMGGRGEDNMRRGWRKVVGN